jgi:glycerophosphoryl diester phosphodiesterase
LPIGQQVRSLWRSSSEAFWSDRVDNETHPRAMTDRPYFTREKPIRLAHRGSRLLWPENTWRAFDGAIEGLGYSYVETDIRVTRDGVVVVFHDETLERTTNGVGKVSDWDWDDLRHLDAGYQFSPDGESFPSRGTGVTLSRLDDTFERYPDVCFNIDLKASRSEWAVAEVITRMRATDRSLVGSFNDRRIARFRRITKGSVATAAGPSASVAMYAASRVGRTVRRGVDAYQLPVKVRGGAVDQKLVDAVHESGAQLHVWTVNEPEPMSELLDIGVDGIVTDRPDILNDVLEERDHVN